ncbi:MAG: glycosyltransferase [Bacteroidales bacterium]|nr:glycosyltransferase [Bacteroidales bacterium]
MGIVIITQGSLGDVRPFLAIGIAFRKQGDEVTVCAPENFRELFTSHGFSYHPVGLNFQAILSNDEADETGKNLRKKNVIQLVIQSISDQFKLLPSVAKDAKLIIGNGLDFAGRSVAEYYKIPYFMISPMPLAFKSKYHSPMTIPLQNLPSWLNRLFWWTGELSGRLLFCKKINRYRRELGLDDVINYTDFMSKNAILAADRILAPLPPDCKNISQIGFLDYDEGIELDEKIIDFINAGAPPIYIGFGSMGDPSSEKTKIILQRLLDVKELRFIISKGWANLNIETTRTNALFIDHVPFAKLFPKMSILVHHGGAGTTCTAVRAGIPQIIIPHGLDQFYWGNRVRALKIGVAPIPRKKLTSKKLIKAIYEVIDNQEYRENAKRIGSIGSKENGVEEALQYIKKNYFFTDFSFMSPGNFL